MRALLAIVLVACSAPPASSPAPVLAGRAERPAPSGPAPRIRWSAGQFDTSSLPAIARDGSLAVVAVSDSDGGRGYPNLRLEVRDRGDRVVETHVIMVSNEAEALIPDSVHAGPELERRIAAANDKLAALHAQNDLVTMRAFDFSPDPFGPSQPARSAGLTVTFGPDHVLRVRARDRRAEKTVAKIDGKSWLAPSGPRCPGCEPCENPAYLAGVYQADGIDAVVVRIAYQGTDLCWEPGDQLHVIAW